jgi:hypothetical protein
LHFEENYRDLDRAHGLLDRVGLAQKNDVKVISYQHFTGRDEAAVLVYRLLTLRPHA